MSTLRTVEQLLVEQFELQQDKVHAETRLAELGIESLASVEFMFLLEDRFALAPAQMLPRFATVGDIAGYIDLLLAKQASPLREEVIER